MAHEVFVSYSSNDKVVADSVVSMLEKNGIRCWYAPRDIKPGSDWGEAIAAGIEESEVFILIFSGNSNRSQRVLDELNLAITRQTVILPFRIEKLDPSGAMMLHLSSRHWLDAYDPSWKPYLGQLVQTTARNIEREDEIQKVENGSVAQPVGPSWSRKLVYALGAGAVLTALIMIFGMDTLFPGGGLPWMNKEAALQETVTPGDQSSVPETADEVSEAAAADSSTTSTAAPGSAQGATPTDALLLGSAENPLVMMYLPPEEEDFSEISAAAGRLVTSFHEEYPELNLKILPAPDMAAAVEAMCDGEAQIASLNAVSYLVASARGCAEVRMIWNAYSDINYGGMIITGSESGVSQLSDLAGTTLCIPAFSSKSGWMLPSLEMRAAIGDPMTYFNEIREMGSHDAVVEAVYNGDCEVGTAYYDARQPFADLPDIFKRVVVLSTTVAAPNQSISFMTTLSQGLTADLLDFFMSTAAGSDDLAFLTGSQNPTEIGSLIEINDYYYNAFRDLFEQSGENPEDYLQLQE
ncbi:MAG: PhnD/SsuA/transferrin family substrate-binding protein [Anaerolineales bacterium]|nr:PhnD/SsuA/transferrin family substrate-binding protein [Anaerolineales bacterium]